MKIYFYRPGDDQFWIGCTEEEAESFFLPEIEKGGLLHYLYMQRRRKQEPRGARLNAMYRQLYGLKSIKEMPEVFFNVSRSQKVGFLKKSYFPIGPMWNGYCPFRMEIEHPKKLLDIEMTLDDKHTVRSTWMRRSGYENIQT